MRILWALLKPRGDGLLLALYAALCVYSLAMQWSVTEPLRGPYASLDADVSKSFFYRQLVWCVAGWALLLACARVPLRYLEELSPLLYLGTAALLVLVLLLAPPVMGARRWFVLGPLRLQPAEMAKISLILILARLFHHYRPAHGRLLPALAALAVTAVPLALVLREPDLGTSLVFCAIWLGMVFWHGVSWVFLLGVLAPAASAVVSFYSEAIVMQPWPWGLYLFLLIGLLYLGRFRFLESLMLLLGNVATGLTVPLLWSWLKPYQQDRVLAFFDPMSDAMRSGYQIIQSKVAIGSGGLFGAHYLQGTQKGLAFLPERHTDFIFSVVGEELGFAGALLLLGLFLALVLHGLKIAQTARRPFASFVAIGVVSYFTFHVVVNVAITTGLAPVTGLPLPFLSYGGSNLLTSALLLGLLANIGSHDYET